jgi:hypothetical protein
MISAVVEACQAEPAKAPKRKLLCTTRWRLSPRLVASGAAHTREAVFWTLMETPTDELEAKRAANFMR